MKLKGYITVALMSLAFISCSDKEKGNADCEEKDTGFLKVTIPGTNLRTAFLFTKVGNSSVTFEEIVPDNTTSKTLEVKTGSYIVSVDQINSSGEAVTDKPLNFNVEIEECETAERTITFSNN